MSEQESAVAEEAARLESARLERERGELLDRAWDMYGFGGQMADLLMTLAETPTATIETFRDRYDVKEEWQRKLLEKVAEAYVRCRENSDEALGYMGRDLAKIPAGENETYAEGMGRLMFARLAGGVPSGRVELERRGLTFLMIAENEDDMRRLHDTPEGEKVPLGLAFGDVRMDAWKEGFSLPIIVTSKRDSAAAWSIIFHEEQHILTDMVFKPMETDPDVWGEDSVLLMKDELIAYVIGSTDARLIGPALQAHYRPMMEGLPSPFKEKSGEFLSTFGESLARFDAAPAASRRKLGYALLSVKIQSIPRAIDLVTDALRRRFPNEP